MGDKENILQVLQVIIIYEMTAYNTQNLAWRVYILVWILKYFYLYPDFKGI